MALAMLIAGIWMIANPGWCAEALESLAESLQQAAAQWGRPAARWGPWNGRRERLFVRSVGTFMALVSVLNLYQQVVRWLAR